MIANLLSSLAELESVSGVYQHDETTWSLYPDGEHEWYVDYVRAKDELVFSANIPLAPIQHREAFYKFLLKANHAWQTSDFCFLALSEDEEYLTLIRAVSAKTLSLSELSRFYREFFNQVSLWKNCSINFSQYQSNSRKEQDDFVASNNHHIKV